ncbi:MAG TPA: sulfotransferase domain-containing protein [Gammaproteobacteria bacterium]|nr:sulfotransferase domain-containing protein [Gammaproteobacteria bacterium]
MIGWISLLLVLALAGAFAWVEYARRGDRYFARPLAQRRQFVRRVQVIASLIRPIFEGIARCWRMKSMPVFHYDGVAGPPIMSSKRAYAATKHYEPRPEDIFVATQMKCGTTWMQQIVFEILHGGEGDLSDEGYRHMYAVSPWIETSPTSSVPMERAPLVGPGRHRIIKTHMPAQLIRHSDAARYVYVTRHPVSCFASCLDFVYLLGGPLTPTRENLLRWYCSDDMLWGSWPDHVESWWRRSEAHDNVLFVHYEALKRDLPGQVRRIAGFLDCPLDEAQVDRVAHKASFEYMREHEHQFEMFAPNVFSVSTPKVRFMQAGTLHRHQDTTPAERAYINAFCRQRLAGRHYPLARFYPDVAEAAAGAEKATGGAA